MCVAVVRPIKDEPSLHIIDTRIVTPRQQFPGVVKKIY